MKYCGEQGCTNLINKGFYCPDHRRRRKRKTKYKHSNKSFYNSGVWKRIRDYVYERDKGLCQECGIFCHGRNAHVHHIVPIAEDPSLKLELSNLKLLCRDCHMIEENKLKAKDIPSYFEV